MLYHFPNCHCPTVYLIWRSLQKGTTYRHNIIINHLFEYCSYISPSATFQQISSTNLYYTHTHTHLVCIRNSFSLSKALWCDAIELVMTPEWNWTEVKYILRCVGMHKHTHTLKVEFCHHFVVVVVVVVIVLFSCQIKHLRLELYTNLMSFRLSLLNLAACTVSIKRRSPADESWAINLSEMRILCLICFSFPFSTPAHSNTRKLAHMSMSNVHNY